MSPGLPAQCTNCGHRFDGQGGIYVGDGSTNITSSGNTMSCPKCHGRAKILEGRFNVSLGSIEMLEGPEWSWDLVEELKLTLRRIIDEKPGDIVGRIAESDVGVAAQFQDATKGLNWRRKFATAVAILGVLTADYNNLVDLAEAIGHLLAYVMEHGRPPTPL